MLRELAWDEMSGDVRQRGGKKRVQHVVDAACFCVLSLQTWRDLAGESDPTPVLNNPPPLLHHLSFPLLLKLCAFEWLQFSSSWWVAVFNKVSLLKVPPTPSLSST